VIGIEEMQPQPQGGPPDWVDEALVDAELEAIDQTLPGWEDARLDIREEALLRGSLNFSLSHLTARGMVERWNECQKVPTSIADFEAVLHPINGAQLDLPSTPGLTIAWWITNGGDPTGGTYTC